MERLDGFRFVSFEFEVDSFVSRRCVCLVFFNGYLVVVRHVNSLPFVEFFIFGTAVRAHVLVRRVKDEIFVDGEDELKVYPNVAANYAPNGMFRGVGFGAYVSHVGAEAFIEDKDLILCGQVNYVRTKVRNEGIQVDLYV